LVVLLGLKGLLRGFVKEFFALVGLVGGVFVASRIASNIGELIASFIPIENNNTVLLIGFIVSLVGFWIIAYIIGGVVSKVFSLSGLGIFDRFLGFVFGAGKIFLLFSIIVYAISNVQIIDKKLSATTQGSIAYPLLKQSGKYIVQIDTSNLQGKISKNIDNAIEATQETLEDISTEVIKEKIDELKEK
jgi:membrane protein required for colicin V production